jgi:hypothetical protein
VPLLPLGFALPRFTYTATQPAAPAANQAGAVAGSAAAGKAAQTAPAAAPAKRQAGAGTAAGPAPAAAGPARPAKRAKAAAAGASTAFMALFTLFMFTGLTPAPMTVPRGGAVLSLSSSPAELAAVAAGQRVLQALPEAPPHRPALPAVADALAGGRRRLQALPAAASEHRLTEAATQPAATPRPAGREGSGHLQALFNSTLQELLHQPGNSAVEAAALARLQELGPVALLLDADGGPRAANPLAASAAFPQLAGGALVTRLQLELAEQLASA